MLEIPSLTQNGSGFDSDSSWLLISSSAPVDNLRLPLQHVGVDSMCNVQILKQLPQNAHNVFATEAENGVNTAGEGGQMHVASTFSWNLDHDFKHCPDARSNLISTSFIIHLRQHFLVVSGGYRLRFWKTWYIATV